MSSIHNPFGRLSKSVAENKLERWKESYDEQFSTSSHIYHYTSVASLSSIIATRQMFCTDYRQLNDSTELSAGLEAIEAKIAAHGHEEGIPSQEINLLLDQLSVMRNGGLFHISMFTASFCRRKNDLSQWRAYAPSHGVCIGFHEPLLKQLAERQRFVCGEVRYIGSPDFFVWLDLQLTELKEGIQKHKVEKAKYRRKAKAEGAPSDQTDLFVCGLVQRNQERWLNETGGLLKHPAFYSEHEWRCVARTSPQDRRLPVRFRTSGSKTIRYVPLEFSDIDLNDLISEVIIGPGPSAQETFCTTADILRDAGICAQVSHPWHPSRTN